MSDLPRVYVTHRLPPPALDLLAHNAQVSVWPGESPPPRAVLMKEVAQADGLLVLQTDRVDADILAAAPRLRIVSNYAVGCDNVDVAAATARGVMVTDAPAALAETTADFTMALMLAAARRIIENDQYVKAGRWRTRRSDALLGRDLFGATLGLVGLGRIGQAVARRAAGFGMRMLYTGPSRKIDAEHTLDLAFVPLEQLLAESDIISLHCPLNDDTYHLLDRDAFALCKPDAMLVNTARGPIVDTRALVENLRTRPMFAALDVTDPQPLPADHPLLGLPNVLVTPHIASATLPTRTRMAMMAAENVLAALRGERPSALVNPQVWEERAVAMGDT